MAGISQRPSWAEVHKSHRPQWEAGIKSLLSLAGDPPAHQPSETFPFPRFGCVFPGLDVFSQPCRAAQRELKKKKSCAENPAVPLYATTSPAHTMGLHDQSSEPAPSSASNGASPDLSHHKGDQESANSPRSKN